LPPAWIRSYVSARRCARRTTRRKVARMSTRALAVWYRSTSARIEVSLSARVGGCGRFPARIEPDETPKYAAVRELRQEAGVVGASVALRSYTYP
jgi:8-oxo-dGTP pyrophosphatase MutT (NUDIX family)